MALSDALPFLQGAFFAVVGLYLLSFRPLERAVGVLGVSMLAQVADDASPWEWLDRAIHLVSGACFVLFLALYPTRVRWGSLGGGAILSSALWLGASAIYVATGHVDVSSPATTVQVALLPGGLGAALALGLPSLARLWELRAGDDARARERAHAARYLYIVFTVVLLTGGGYLAARTLAATAGINTFPDFLYTTSDPAYTWLAVATWWLLPAAVAVLALARWRWWLPAGLLAAGALSYAPLLWSTPDARTVIYLRGWGGFLWPGLILYAQARWQPFRGEPTAVRSTILVTLASAVLAYLFVHVLVLAVLPDPTLAGIAAPLLGFAGAIAIAILVLPRARRLELQRAFGAATDPGGGPLAPGRVLLGRYEVVRLLGEGGQARVYEAVDRKRGRARVVLKAATSEDAAREARILRDLRHPNIVGFVDIVEAPGVTLLVLEYAEGGNLRGLLARRGGRLEPSEAARIADGILAGLAEAHARGVVHGDVKPENVLIDADGTARLTDFGNARELAPSSTVRVGGLGTLAYLAPEQARGEPGDARSDVYAAGILLHELAAGAHPLPLPDDAFLARRAIASAQPRIALSPETRHVAPVIERALAKDPAARFGGAREMLAALRAARAAQLGTGGSK